MQINCEKLCTAFEYHQRIVTVNNQMDRMSWSTDITQFLLLAAQVP